MFTKLFVNAKVSAHFFMKNRDGVTAIEYAIIAAAMAAVLISLFATDAGSGLTQALKNAFNKITTTLGGTAVS
ncbi:Flp family type IVb pilin [Marinomonas sp. TI.3.20]|uniref:Flp family type IVb pilin n=1 Tax=Marinomonas sp. TI.3.20 TaxID=3121296 RepID=UPI00311E3098